MMIEKLNKQEIIANKKDFVSKTFGPAYSDENLQKIHQVVDELDCTGDVTNDCQIDVSTIMKKLIRKGFGEVEAHLIVTVMNETYGKLRN